ncbi:hypothetical protein L1987_59309 [Smallanthus sonchifolius]|uniref:Uncharacterized protein n=1 Tax=Smallanthus sonchifolius TaxID=185202 RepID=A0ACB9D5C7_9ASTR|nr:hypothetical protein L1987_59309 [Smallanthus sonchifolius]
MRYGCDHLWRHKRGSAQITVEAEGQDSYGIVQAKEKGIWIQKGSWNCYPRYGRNWTLQSAFGFRQQKAWTATSDAELEEED